MIKRLSMAAIMSAWIFAPARLRDDLVAVSANSRDAGGCRFPLASEYYKIRYALTHGGAIVVSCSVLVSVC